MFIATNFLAIPIQDALISKPILIEKKTVKTETLKETNLLDRITQQCEDAHNLRGEVMSELILFKDENEQTSCMVTLREDFIDMPQLINKAMYSFQSIFREPRIDSAQVAISKTQSNLELDKLFKLELTRKEFNFVRSKIEGMDTDYKMVQLGAIIRHYQLPEAQIL